MEETIAYETLAAEEWDEIDPNGWPYRDHDRPELEPLDIDQLSSGVTVIAPGARPKVRAWRRRMFVPTRPPIRLGEQKGSQAPANADVGHEEMPQRPWRQ